MLPLAEDGPQSHEAAFRLGRRTSLGLHPDRMREVVERADRSWDDAVGWVMNQPAIDDVPPTRRADADSDGDDGDESWDAPVFWWVDLLSSADAGLTDRMAWFWHTLLTTNVEKVSTVGLVAEQLHTLRTLGRGDFRTLLQAFVGGGALQEYLDGSRSLASNPNENLGRELMELFTLGQQSSPTSVGESTPGAGYSEDDVKAAARALAGWVVDDGALEFRRENAFIAPLIFLGQQARWDTTKIVDRLCDHPATASNVAGRLWLHLVGTPLSEQDRAELGQWWAGRDLAIDPLIERILSSSAFIDPGIGRARSGLEWYCAARSALGASGQDHWELWSIGQVPYHPPNVAGWQDYSDTNTYGQRWLSAGSLLGRTSAIWSILNDAGLYDEALQGNDKQEDDDANFAKRFPLTSEDILSRSGISAPSEQTWAALDSVGDAGGNDGMQAHTIGQIRWRLALSSPEFNLL